MFSVIFLRFSLLKVVAVTAGLILSVGLTLKLITRITSGFIEAAGAAAGLTAATNELSRTWREFFRVAGEPFIRDVIVPLIKAVTALSRLIIAVLTPAFEIITPIAKYLWPVFFALAVGIATALIPVFISLGAVLLMVTARLVAQGKAFMISTILCLRHAAAVRAFISTQLAATVATKLWNVTIRLATVALIALQAPLWKTVVAVTILTGGLALLGAGLAFVLGQFVRMGQRGAIEDVTKATWDYRKALRFQNEELWLTWRWLTRINWPKRGEEITDFATAVHEATWGRSPAIVPDLRAIREEYEKLIGLPPLEFLVKISLIGWEAIKRAWEWLSTRPPISWIVEIIRRVPEVFRRAARELAPIFWPPAAARFIREQVILRRAIMDLESTLRAVEAVEKETRERFLEISRGFGKLYWQVVGAEERRRRLLGIAPGLQFGGIIVRPTLIRAGEQGPEAIIPLRRFGALSPIININITGNYILDDPTASILADRVSERVERTLIRMGVTRV